MVLTEPSVLVGCAIILHVVQVCVEEPRHHKGASAQSIKVNMRYSLLHVRGAMVNLQGYRRLGPEFANSRTRCTCMSFLNSTQRPVKDSIVNTSLPLRPTEINQPM